MGQATPASSRAVAVRWSAPRHDPWRLWTWTASAGLVAAAAMATFGLPPVDLHGLLHYIGIMDPLCGGTRAVRLAARGDWAASFTYNPIGIPLVIGAAALLIRAGLGLTTGRWATIEVTLGRSTPRRLKILAGAASIALAINQQLHAPMLIQAG